MKLSRRLVSLVLCFSVCLIGFAVPVFAADYTWDYTGYWKGDSEGEEKDSFYGRITEKTGQVVAFGLSELLNDGIYFTDDSPIFEKSVTANFDRFYHRANAWIWVQFDFSGELNLTDAYFQCYYKIGDAPEDFFPGQENIFYVDDDVVLEDLSPRGWSWSGTVGRSFGIRVYSPYPAGGVTFNAVSSTMGLRIKLGGLIEDEGTLNDVISGITVMAGTTQEINGKVTDIVDSVTHIDTTLTNIDTNISDTKQQLETSGSNIWQAAGQTIKDAVVSLFVPSQSEIESVKQGFDELAQDKLGGAYTAMQTVENTVAQVNSKLNNPSAAEGVSFPGISVPLGGEVGVVTLAAPQTVTLPTELTATLHPVAGTIISIICGLGTFNVLKDMVECFLSGFSYAEYLHRNKGGSSE